MVMGNSLYVLYVVHSITYFGSRYNDIIYYEISTLWASLESTITQTHGFVWWDMGVSKQTICHLIAY